MGGRMVDFGGWDMPVQYPAGTIEEHLRTRTHAGLFDVSHMGEIEVRGANAIPFVNYLTSNDVSKLIDGQAQYSALTTPEGTVIDDLLVYRFAEDHLLLVVNAGTTEKDWDWIKSHHTDQLLELHNVSATYCQLAIQGPDALCILHEGHALPAAVLRDARQRAGDRAFGFTGHGRYQRDDPRQYGWRQLHTSECYVVFAEYCAGCRNHR